MNKQIQKEVRTVVRGRIVKAIYRETVEMPEAQDNPLITALPAPWDWDEEKPRILSGLTRYFSIDREKILEETMVNRRFQLVRFKLHYFQVLDRHRKVEQSISYCLRFGYLGRNPIALRYRRNLYERIEAYELDAPNIIASGNLCFSLLGSPGLGKTITVGRLLQLYPQVILHSEEYLNHIQLVWLFLTCPHDKSTKGLCTQFLTEVDEILGTNYSHQYSGENEDGLMSAMAKVAASLSLGILVIDEIQFLSSAKSGGKEDMLKFFIQLENTLGIPVVLVGTHRAANLIAGSPHQARRSVGMGGHTWRPLAMDDPEWEIFLENMWRHQFTNKYVKLTDELAIAFYKETQGIPNYAISLFYFMQHEAIQNGNESFTLDDIEQVGIDSMEYDRPYINALKMSDKLYAQALQDIVPPDYENPPGFFADQLLLPVKRVVNSHTSQIMVVNASSSTDGSSIIPSLQPAPGSVSTTTSASSKTRKKRLKKSEFPPGSIMAVVEEAASQDIAPYEALKTAGLIRAANEFMPATLPV